MKAPHIILCDIRPNIAIAWHDAIQADGSDLPKVSVIHGDILNLTLPPDALVSPANSFGFMDGGIDLVYTKRFGPQLQEDVQAAIAMQPFGELLVGDALDVPIRGSEAPSRLIVAPTMRVPLRITDCVDIYLATRAAVRRAYEAQFKTVAIPGMGTGCGLVQPPFAAQAMIAGIRDGIRPVSPPGSIIEATNAHVAFWRV